MFRSRDWSDDRAMEMRHARNLTVAMVGVVTLTGVVLGAAVLPLAMISLALAVSAILAARVGGQIGALILGIALVGQAIVFTATFAGHPWQIDSHMLFFVVLAVGAVMRSIPALFAMTVMTAVHHLGFGVLIPALVFPSVNLIENVERVAFHAVIVILEVSFLTMSILSQDRKDAAKQAAQQEATEATTRAELAATEAQSLRAEAETASAAARNVTAMLERNLHAMASRDLRARMDGDPGAEFRQMSADYNQAVGNVSRTLAGAKTMVRDVEAEAAASAEMTVSMASELERQAVEVTGAARSIRTLSESLDTTVGDILSVRDQAQIAASKATEGGAIVRDAVDAMAQITASSTEIEKIIQVIEEISFQTNLLALNAGVEAARAGQAGAGFAVVASEVRALSHRTSEAANQVKTLISASSSQVAAGADMVDRAGVALDEIERSIEDASGRVADISERATEQSSAVQDVSGSLAQIDTVIQSFATRTEEISAIGARVVADAERLHGLLGEFIIIDDTDDAWSADGPPQVAA
ncbi:methyl-accepting chemotaxis protein [Jannaschia sp. CCS1]|uniref:methyl-accepting chemotaxis protein n=1 Tax=Jannaschia sp. (strain CCS1) TaxID=290400 RepID=UPI000053CD70|nr:methyl-accepting chemotaxis protein [Jannaschia sp. CCS1]ABD55286.1 methyl-accepting chemotaxis sensory transducer [Jannaschia sp. CCS1]